MTTETATAPMLARITPLSRNGSADGSWKISCYQLDKERLPLSHLVGTRHRLVGDFRAYPQPTSENFADYRAQLLPWAECEARLPAYCTTLGIAERGEDFAAALKAELTTLAAAVDVGFAANSEL